MTSAAPPPAMSSFDDFWPFYLSEHGTLGCRVLHLVGFLGAASLLATAIVTKTPWLAIAAYCSGYVPAWFGHFFIEKNKPAAFRHPWWSLVGDWRMCVWMLRGRLWSTRPVLEQAGLASGSHDVSLPAAQGAATPTSSSAGS